MSGMILIILVLALYFVPWVIASSRKHPQVSPIALLNLFLGWTFLGWVAALVWAVSSNNKAPDAR